MLKLSVTTTQAISHPWALKKSSFPYKVCVQMKHTVVGSEVGRSTQPMGSIGNGLIMKLSGIHPFLFMIHRLLWIVQPRVLSLQIAHWCLRREERWKLMGAMSRVHSCVHWLRVSYSSSSYYLEFRLGEWWVQARSWITISFIIFDFVSLEEEVKGGTRGGEKT